MKVAIGSDHAGYELKEFIKKYLAEKNFELKDYGTNSMDACNYPEFGEKVANAIINKECDCGILICGTGIGISISANKVKGIRCAVCSEPVSARLCKEHNNANIIAFGARIVGTQMAMAIVDAYFSASFLGGKHQNRIDLLTDIENRN